MTHPYSARRRRSVWLQIAWWSCLKVTFLFKLWDGLAVQSFTNLRNILASLIIIVQHLLRTVCKDYFLIGLRKEKISPVLNNLEKRLLWHTFIWSFLLFFQRRDSSDHFAFIQLLFSERADGRLTSPKNYTRSRNLSTAIQPAILPSPLALSPLQAVICCQVTSGRSDGRRKTKEGSPPLTSSCSTGQREAERMQRVHQSDLQTKTVHSGMDAPLSPGSSPHFSP